MEDIWVADIQNYILITLIKNNKTSVNIVKLITLIILITLMMF